ncbi:hypothetical protein DPMN_169903 [Dreissena polymorpha]|uniref:Uncharacterized protein n=1 Tax=Dreissena polymorpha TaxID=45954 RepID=A0A9D4DVF6_DREPO|nr:hypothetical protein DPMN_169903 [Dreissena polymorpha]
MKITNDVADAVHFEGVYRFPGQAIPWKTRSIAAKFAFFKDREAVRKKSENN